MDRSLLYVSESRLAAADVVSEIEKIVTLSQSRNAALGVTGALIATRHEFAQILEGSQAAINSLMASISADPRHANIRVLQYIDITRRRFRHWTLAYAGPATYVVSLVEPLLESCPTEVDPVQVRDLICLMEEFTRARR